MFKLLTEKTKEVVRKEYMLRRAVVIMYMVILVLIVAIAGLFPSFVLSEARQEEIAARTVIGEKTSTEEQKEISSWVNSFNQKLKLLNPKFDELRASETITAALSERGAGISVTEIRWFMDDSGKYLVLSGVANDRQALVAFESRLNALKKFGDVSLPLSNLARDKDINFQVKLHIQ